MIMVLGEGHDYKNFPELTNTQLDEFGFSSPHKQIVDDFYANVEKVVDGDTVRLSTEGRDFVFPLRLLNIDAPEMSEGGEEAKDWLKGMIEGSVVQIIIDKNNRVGKYGRLLGNVESLGMDVGEMSLMLGYSVPFGTKNAHDIPDLNKDLRATKWF